jgi:hypothetical protein
MRNSCCATAIAQPLPADWVLLRLVGQTPMHQTTQEYVFYAAPTPVAAPAPSTGAPSVGATVSTQFGSSSAVFPHDTEFAHTSGGPEPDPWTLSSTVLRGALAVLAFVLFMVALTTSSWASTSVDVPASPPFGAYTITESGGLWQICVQDPLLVRPDHPHPS